MRFLKKSKFIVLFAVFMFNLFCSTDCMHLVSGSYDKTVRVWNMDGRCKRVKRCHAPVRSIFFAQRGKKFTSSFWGNKVRVWDIQTMNYKEFEMPRCFNVFSVSLSPSGKKVLVSSFDTSVGMLDVETGKVEGIYGKKSVSNSKSGDDLFYSSSCPVCSVSFSNNDTKFVLAEKELVIMSKEKCGRYSYRSLEAGERPVKSLSFSLCGKMLASGGDGKTVRIWNVEAERCEATLGEHSDQVKSVSLSPDGKKVASGGKDKTVRIWDLQMGECKVLRGHSDFVFSVSFSPDGKRVASGSKDKTIRLWNVETGKCEKVLRGHRGSVLSVAFCPVEVEIVDEERQARLQLLQKRTNLFSIMQLHKETESKEEVECKKAMVVKKGIEIIKEGEKGADDHESVAIYYTRSGRDKNKKCLVM